MIEKREQQRAEKREPYHQGMSEEDIGKECYGGIVVSVKSIYFALF